MEILKKYLFDVVAVVAFAILAYAYFVPATIDGRILYQHDSAAGREDRRDFQMEQRHV